MQMRIGIFTPFSLDPVHPRTEMIANLLKRHGHHVDVLQNKRNNSKVLKLLKIIFLNYFDISALPNFAQQIDQYDLIFIQDLRNLPLAFLAKRKHKAVIYETLDNNIYLRYYYLAQRNLMWRIWGFLMIPLMKTLERFLALKYSDKIIVNSNALKNYFWGKARVVFYSSPYEQLKMPFLLCDKIAFLYLGAVSEEKGFFEMLDIQKIYKARFFIFGSTESEIITEIITSNPEIVWKDRISSCQLAEEIEKISKEYFLIGLSLIKSVHYSYATQEANKDIDYLALGIPIIGNHRQPTKEKIKAGCGVFIEDKIGIKSLFTNPQNLIQISLRCREYYQENYSQEIFESNMLQVIREVYEQ